MRNSFDRFEVMLDDIHKVELKAEQITKETQGLSIKGNIIWST